MLHIELMLDIVPTMLPYYIILYHTFTHSIMTIMDLDLHSLSTFVFHLWDNNWLIVFLTESYVCHLLVVCNTPSVWPLGHTLAREYRYQHVLLYGSTCWLVRKSFSTNTLLQLKTLSSVHGICRTFLSNVFRRMSVSSGLCLKEMMHTTLRWLWLATPPWSSQPGDPTRWP